MNFNNIENRNYKNQDDIDYKLVSWCSLFSPIFKYRHSLRDMIYLFLKYEISRNHNTSYDDYGYYIWNGNICHIFALNIANNECVDGIIDYIEFLYFICKYKNINRIKNDSLHKTPYDYYIQYSITGIWDCSMKLVLCHPLYIIEKMQAYIRGFLCRRRLLKKKYSQCVCEIIHAPLYQYGCHFHGGSEYIKYIEKYNI